MSMFPGPGARIDRNEAGEPIGWDYPSMAEDDPYDEAYPYDEDYYDEGDYYDE